MTFTVNTRPRTIAYYIADRIYPRYASFVTPYPDADTPKKRTYNRLQEALRTDVQRLYAVLTGRFNVLLHPARFTTVEKLRQAARAVTILQNIMVKQNRHGNVSVRRVAAGLYADVANEGVDDGAAHMAEAAGEVAAGMHEQDPDPDQEQLVGILVNNPVNAEGILLQSFQARQQALDQYEQELSRDDLAEHIFPNREQLLLPHTG